jgi:hypothetical protein
MRAARLLMGTVIISSLASICEGSPPNVSDLKSAWQANQGKCGIFKSVDTALEFSIPPDGKGSDCISSVGNDFVLIKSGQGNKIFYVFVPMQQIILTLRE